MSTGSISRFVLRHKAMVAIVWLVIAVAGAAGSGPASEALSVRFDLPGSESSDADSAIVADRVDPAITLPGFTTLTENVPAPVPLPLVTCAQV